MGGADSEINPIIFNSNYSLGGRLCVESSSLAMDDMFASIGDAKILVAIDSLSSSEPDSTAPSCKWSIFLLSFFPLLLVYYIPPISLDAQLCISQLYILLRTIGQSCPLNDWVGHCIHLLQFFKDVFLRSSQGHASFLPPSQLLLPWP